MLNIDNSKYFSINQNIRVARHHEHNFNIVTRKYNTLKGQMFYTNRVILLWDKLPVNIKLIKYQEKTNQF